MGHEVVIIIGCASITSTSSTKGPLSCYWQGRLKGYCVYNMALPALVTDFVWCACLSNLLACLRQPSARCKPRLYILWEGAVLWWGQPAQLYLLPIETANAHEMGCAVDAYPAAKKMPT